MSEKIFALVMFIVGLSLGYLIPKHSNLPAVPSASPDQGNHPNLDNIKSKLQKISDEDINEYIRLKDMKTKYEKADEIFGKILNIFLLDLGLRVSPKQLEDLKTSSQSLAGNNKLDPQAKAPDSSAGRAQSAQHVPTEDTIPTKINFESNEQISKMLNEKNLSNPLATWSAAKPLTRDAFNAIDGRFAGNILFLDQNRNPLDLEMELSNASFDKGQLIGEFLLKTTDPSNPKYRDTTRFKPNSKIPNFRQAADGAILVEAMGGDGIFQLYYSPQTNSFQGNLYEKSGLDSFKRSGSIILNRR